MKPTIYIHIGLHKTGSTSIQATFYKNRAKLLEHGINYLATGENHSETVFPLFAKDPLGYRLHRLQGIDTLKKSARKNAASKAVLIRELTHNSSPRLVISGEDLSALKQDEVARLRDFLAPYVAAMRVIAYVRDPFDVLNSAFQERLRRGETAEHILLNPPGPSYKRLDRYVRVFGRSDVDIRVFDRARFPDGDLIADFISALGLNPMLTRQLDGIVANQALSHEAAYLLDIINRDYGADENGRLHPRRARRLIEWLRRIPGQPFRCPSELLAAKAARIENNVRWIRQLVGENVFRDRVESWQRAPQWTDQTLAAMALLINDLAARKAMRQRRGILARLTSWRATGA